MSALAMATSVSAGPALLTLLALVVPYFAYKIYKSTAVPPALAHLPRIPISATLKSVLTPGGFINENKVQVEAVQKYCVEHGMDKDAWRDMHLIWLFGTWGVVLGKPEHLRTVFLNTDTFPKFLYGDVGFELHQKFVGFNVILSNGDMWKLHRKVANPAFHRSWSTQVMGTCSRTLLEQLDLLAGTPVDLFDWMQRVTLDVLSLATFGQNLDALRNPNSHIVTLYNNLMKDLQRPLFQLMPFLQKVKLIPLVRDIHRRIDEFDAFVDGVIQAKEAEVKQRLAAGVAKDEKDRDLLECMIEAAMNDPEFTRRDLRSNLVIFFIAGHDTTASSLVTSLYYLALHPEFQTKARAEVLSVLGDVDNTTTSGGDFPVPTTAEQAQFDYLTCIIKEALRLYPAVTGLPLRRTAKPITMGTVAIPKGTPIHADIFGVQRNPAIWGDDAGVFRPERWLEDRAGGAKVAGTANKVNAGASVNSEKDAVKAGTTAIPMTPSAHGFAWVPFGGGQRMCLGQQFSLIEQRVVLSMLLLRYEWTLAGDADALKGHPKTASGVLLHPVDVKLNFKIRGTK
ncbi:cytochrome P450-dit2 [Allomyces javanicus]|nr:cytochrome P450-dit2 [Allomyces javanicus]